MNNYAIGGTTSMSLVHYLRDEDNWPELKTLKETDLIFIDYSVNDGLAHKTPLEVDQLERNLELIIRDLYSRMNSSIPAIVFIEHWPYGATAYYQPKPENPPAEGPSSDYAAGYRRVARHYHLPIWSYREAVWTDFAERNTSGFIEYLRFNNNLNSARQTRAHPPWPIHLYLSGNFSTSPIVTFCTYIHPQHAFSVLTLYLLHNLLLSYLLSPPFTYYHCCQNII